MDAVRCVLQMFQLTLNLHCSLMYQVVTKDVNSRNDGQLVFEGQYCLINMRDLVTLRKYLGGGTAVCFLPDVCVSMAYPGFFFGIGFNKFS
jgi:hypothetical protein